MVQGRLKRELRKRRVRHIIKKVTLATGSLIAVALLCTSIKISTEAKNKVEYSISEGEELISDVDLSGGVLAGATLAMRDYSCINIESNNLELLKSSITKYDNLIKPGTELYASTNVNARVEPSKESSRICGISFGDKVVVIEDTGEGWAKVNYKNKEVYVCTEYFTNEAPMMLVSSTAYWDEYNRTSASGRDLVEGKSVAGKVSWLHKSVNIYKCNSDGTVGKFLGTYRFDDTGYGAESGVGESKILKGKTIGTIENGTCIDIYFENEADCWNYGRRNVYIHIID